MNTSTAARARAALALACLALVAAAALALAACGGGSTTASNPSSAAVSAAPSALPTPAPTPTVAGTIAFTSDHARTGNANISLVRTDGSGLRRVVKTSRPESSCAWAPDGKAILFLRTMGGINAPGDVCSVRPDGSGLTQVTSAGGIGDFALSPDGSWLALHEPWEHRIVLLPYGASGPPQTVLAADFDWGSAHISWSPDGKALVLGRSKEIGSESRALVIVNADGGGLSAIPGVAGMQPEWRPE
jgi:Tol biopolymer transport system component